MPSRRAAGSRRRGTRRARARAPRARRRRARAAAGSRRRGAARRVRRDAAASARSAAPSRSPRGERERRLDRVLELAHVARPVVRGECRERLGREAQHRRIGPPVLLEEVLGEQRNVVAPLAQRRQRQPHHVAAGSRGPAGSGPPATISARSRWVAPITRMSTGRRAGAAERAHLARLERAQQLGLRSPAGSRRSRRGRACRRSPRGTGRARRPRR